MGSWKQGTTVTAGCVLAIALATSGTARADGDRKMDRQIELFERILDDVLVESPNWLVQGHHEARGRYHAGEGVRFSFDASLTSGGDRWMDGKWWRGLWRDDDRVVIIRGDDDDDEKADRDDKKAERDEKKSDRDDRRALRKSWIDHELKRQERLYKRGKAELVDAILQDAELLKAVPDAEFITIDVDLRNNDYFDDKDIDSLVLKAKMADVRAYSDGKIDEKTMVERVQVQES
ncbi:MAG: hypothetical protein U0167_02170 [bacterium]